MRLEGSCHCGAVRFALQSRHPYPFNLCYCSICRKTAGSGGYAINLSGDFTTLVVEGEEYIRVFHAKLRGPDGNELGVSPGERRFCQECGTPLWVWDPRWPKLVHPFASAVDTELPKPPERTHLLIDSRPSWLEIRKDKQDKCFSELPEESIADWHERLELTK